MRWPRWIVLWTLLCGVLAVMDDSDTELRAEAALNDTQEVPVGRTLFLLTLLKKKLLKLQELDRQWTTTAFPWRGCICVPFYLCSANGTIITDGAGVIDVRQRQCTGDLEVCCFPRTVLPTAPNTAAPPPTMPVTIPTTLATLPTTIPTTTTTTTTTPRPTTLSTLPTTTTTPRPTTLPTTVSSQPLQYCICIPIFQCAIFGALGGGTTTRAPGVIDPRQQPANTCVGAYVCCSAAQGSASALPTTAMTAVTFPPFVLPTIPTTAAPAAQLPPIVLNQSCICLLAALCSSGSISMAGLANIDPRLILGRQGQPAGTCSANSMCCRLSSGGAAAAAAGAVQTNPITPNRQSTAGGDIKNPGTADACSCVPTTACAEGNAVTYDGVGAIDPRFGPCASATLVCCRLQTRQKTDVLLALGTAQSPVFLDPTVTASAQAICGLRDTTYADSSPQSSTAYFAEFPWMALLLIRRPGTNDVFQCGGSLITTRAVLTAAHCVSNCDPGTLVARLGEWNTQNANEPLPFQEASVQNILVHPQFNSGGLYNDVAIVVLTRPVTYTLNVRPVCLPTEGQTFAAGTICYASGWGRNAFGTNGQYQSILRKVDLPIVDRANCQTSLRATRLGPTFALHSSFICAGGQAKKDTCYKDGGGPLVCQDGNTGRFVQAGIISWGIGCGDSTPAVYANVAQHRQWILQNLLLYGIYN